MPIIRDITHPPPTYLYKYSKSGDFEGFLSKGIVRLGHSAFYRKAYDDRGAGFGDPDECANTTLLPGGFVARDYCDWYILSLSTFYSKGDHVRWFRRIDCGYNFCVAVHGTPLVRALEAAVGRMSEDYRQIVAGRVAYDKRSTFSVNGSISGTVYRAQFSKRDSCA